jgi:hypothetical protein
MSPEDQSKYNFRWIGCAIVPKRPSVEEISTLYKPQTATELANMVTSYEEIIFRTTWTMDNDPGQPGLERIRTEVQRALETRQSYFQIIARRAQPRLEPATFSSVDFLN